jgi:hypothetical protein
VSNAMPPELHAGPAQHEEVVLEVLPDLRQFGVLEQLHQGASRGIDGGEVPRGPSGTASSSRSPPALVGEGQVHPLPDSTTARCRPGCPHRLHRCGLGIHRDRRRLPDRLDQCRDLGGIGDGPVVDLPAAGASGPFRASVKRSIRVRNRAPRRGSAGAPGRAPAPSEGLEIERRRGGPVRIVTSRFESRIWSSCSEGLAGPLSPDLRSRLEHRIERTVLPPGA